MMHRVNLILFLCVFTFTGYSQIVQTIAGTGIAGYNGDLIKADTSKIGGVNYVTIDRYGNIYYSDFGNNIVRRVDPSGLLETVAGSDSAGYTGDGGLAVHARLNTPHGLCVDWSGNLYIADAGNNCIRKVSTDGLITTVAGIGLSGFAGDGGLATNAQLNFPCGIAVDSMGNLFIADTHNEVIRKVNNLGVILTIAGNPYGPGGYNGDGYYAYQATLNQPYDIALDQYLNVYIADLMNNCIREIDTAGMGFIYTIAGTGDAGFFGDGSLAINAQLDAPTGIAVDYNLNIYISDLNNQRIRKVSPYGIINTIVGTGTAGYNGDGLAPLATQLNTPQSVGVDPAGNVYVADFGNSRVREANEHAGVIVENSKKVHFDVFPNPTSQPTIYCRLETEYQVTTCYTILDVYGSTVASVTDQSNKDIHFNSQLPAGSYFVIASNIYGKWTARLVSIPK